MKPYSTLLFILLLTLSSVVTAEVSGLTITDPVLRATPPSAPVAGGYLTIKNNSGQADRLVGGTSAFSSDVEVHEMAMDGEMMRMRELESGIEIAPGAEVMLKPGGLHIMFFGLKEQLVEGEKRSVTLQFEKAGTIELEFDVKKIMEGGHSMDRGKDMKKMDHGKDMKKDTSEMEKHKHNHH